MDDLSRLADLIDKRNALENEITALINRPASIGHIGEFIASRVFDISLEKSASHKSIDGHFSSGPLMSRSVNIKWYGLWEGLLDLTPDALPDFYLVLTGPKAKSFTSRGQVRHWTIDFVFLFEAKALVDALLINGVKTGVATSIRNSFWEKAEIFPIPSNNIYILTAEQRELLGLFGAKRGIH